MSGLSNGQQATLMLLAFMLTPLASWLALGAPTDHQSLAMLGSSLIGSTTTGGILAFIKEILGGKPSETTGSGTSAPVATRLFMNFRRFFYSFLKDTQGRYPRRKKTFYDPDPKPRRHRHRRSHDPRPRRGIEPAGLKRWRLTHRRRHDPGYRSTFWKGPRGGHYFKGPRKRRYDPQPRRPWRSYARGAGSKLEHGINRHGGILGALISLAYGIWHGYTEYQTAYGGSAGKNYLATITGGDLYDANGTKIGYKTPEISKLWGTNDSTWGGGIDKYLKYKFLGLNDANQYVGSSWSMAFILSLIGVLAAPIARLFTSKGQRILRPISKISKGALIVSTIGALALPGSGEQSRTVNMVKAPNGSYAQNPQTNIKNEGAY